MSRSLIRVLHVIDGLAGGGAERWVYDIVRLSRSDDVEHRVVSVFPDVGDFVYRSRLVELGAYDSRAVTGVAMRSLEIKVRELAASGRTPSLRRALALALQLGRPVSATWRAVRELIRFRPHVIHGHCFQGLAVALVVSRLSGRPLVHTVPGLLEQMHDAGFWWMPYLYKRSGSIDCFFAGASLAELEAMGVPRGRVVWIEGVVDLGRIDGEVANRRRHRTEVRTAWGIPVDAPLALSVGRLHRSKGFECALEALPSVLAKAPEFHWVVVGEGEERGNLTRRARELGVESHVHLVGFNSDPLPFYAAADLYIRPHVIEGDNLSSFDAMGFGLPVVGFDTRAENERIKAVGHGILVPNRDHVALGAAIGRLLAEEDRGAERGARGAVYAAHHFSLRAAVEKFVVMYRRLAETRRPQGYGSPSSGVDPDRSKRSPSAVSPRS
jgi:glycosyltransferase involved in cell wall biosynthesis